jgi:Ring finger domain
MKKNLLFLALIYSLFIYVLLNWDNFEDCYAPIQISLITATSLILSRYILKCVRLCLSNRCFITLITFQIIWAIPILLIVTVIAGLVWISQNMEYSDTCGTSILPPEVIIVIMAVVFCVDLYFIYCSVVESFNWNILLRNHRRIRNEIDAHFDVVAYISIPDEISPKRLSEKQLESLEVKKCRRSFSMLEVCAICASDYKEDDELLFVPGCTHHYHAECVKVWFKMNSTCPSCRNDISKFISGVNV